MITKKFRCRNCGKEFRRDVFEAGEAQRKQQPSSPVHCPECNRTDVIEDR